MKRNFVIALILMITLVPCFYSVKENKTDKKDVHVLNELLEDKNAMDREITYDAHLSAEPITEKNTDSSSSSLDSSPSKKTHKKNHSVIIDDNDEDWGTYCATCGSLYKDGHCPKCNPR